MTAEQLELYPDEPSSRPDSPVKTSRSPESARGSTATDPHSSSMSLASSSNSVPPGWSSRTFQDSSAPMGQTTSIDAYAAGLIDGEGCIYLQDSARKSEGQRSFSVVVEVGMTVKALPVLEALQRAYGGRIYSTRPATEKWA